MERSTCQACGAEWRLAERGLHERQHIAGCKGDPRWWLDDGTDLDDPLWHRRHLLVIALVSLAILTTPWWAPALVRLLLELTS